jgi:hypothetical protein
MDRMIYILTSCIVDCRQDAVHVQFGAKKKAFIKKKEKRKRKGQIALILIKLIYTVTKSINNVNCLIFMST